MRKYVECRIIDVDESPRPRCSSIMPRSAVVAVRRRSNPAPLRTEKVGKYLSPSEQMYWQGLLLNCQA